MEKKVFEIDFNEHFFAQIAIEDGTPVVIACMNGWGEAVSLENIIVTELKEG